MHHSSPSHLPAAVVQVPADDPSASSLFEWYDFLDFSIEESTSVPFPQPEQDPSQLQQEGEDPTAGESGSGQESGSETGVFEFPGAPTVSHITFAVVFVATFVAARFILDKFVIQRLAVWLLSREATTRLKLDEATRKKISNCTESMRKLIYYTIVEFLLLKTAYHEPWFIDSKLYFIGWPHQELKLSLKLIYICQCGFYVYSIVALLFWEIRQKDFSVLMCHHVVTVLLIAFSYITRYPQRMEQAERAIGAFHCQYTFPGVAFPMKVKYADGEREQLDDSLKHDDSCRENKLFDLADLYPCVFREHWCAFSQVVCRLLEQIFSPFGVIEEIFLVRGDFKQIRGV